MENREPKIGEKIYVPSSYHVYRGEDDFEGGLAIINTIDNSKHLPKDHYNYTMVGIEGQPGTKYNWKHLLEEQEELKEQYKDRIAHASPDLRPEFNDNESDWR